MSAAQKVEIDQPFLGAEEAFESLLAELSGSEVLSLNHGGVERLILHKGMEVLRQLLQGHLILRGRGDIGPSVTGADDIQRSKKRMSVRRLASLFGVVLVARVLYASRDGGVRALAPCAEQYSHGVRRRVASLSARISFDQVAAEIEATTGAKPPKRQVEELARRAAADFDEFYNRRAVTTDAPGDLLVLTVDGSPMRQGSCRLLGSVERIVLANRKCYAVATTSRRRPCGRRGYRCRIVGVS